MTIIRQDDVIRSVADALQYISFYGADEEPYIGTAHGKWGQL